MKLDGDEGSSAEPSLGSGAAHSLEAAKGRWGEELERRLRVAVIGDGVLFEAARYHLDTGGKRLRALIPPWICGNLGGDPAAALDLGVAFELIHNGTLVHDDLQDGDVQRRGRPTVWTRFGMPQAVNVGTALLLLGLAEVLKTPVGARIVADVNLAVLAIVEGQALEFELGCDPAPTPDKWVRMARGKTGALFGACFLGGACAAGLGDADGDAVRALGLDLGVFFQLQDDLLDLVGDKGRELPATDLAEGKISWPVAWVAVNGAPAERERLMAIVKTERARTTAAMVEEALAILHTSGAIAACAAECARLAAELEARPFAHAMPGLVQRVLEPVAHVMRGRR